MSLCQPVTWSMAAILRDSVVVAVVCTRPRAIPLAMITMTKLTFSHVFSLPLKDQVSANVVKKRLTDLSSKIRTTIQPVFVSRKLKEDLKVREVKPVNVSQQFVVYKFQCNLCDAGYVGYTRGHLHERVDGHNQKSSSICKHYFGDHNSNVPPCLSEQFHVLTKCTNKFDCLIKDHHYTCKWIRFARRYSLKELVILCCYVNL